MPTLLSQDLARSIQAYWRIRAGVAFLRGNQEKLGTTFFTYAQTGVSAVYSLPSSESSVDAFNAIHQYVLEGSLSRDYFLRIIGHLEAFYIRKLGARGLSIDGTLGGLQKRCEQSYGVASHLCSVIDEIRERRNSFMHHEGVPDAKYSAAAQVVYLASGGVISDPSTVSQLDVSNAYLNYCVDNIASYAILF